MAKTLNKLLIFTKSPILGEVKTRLQPEYSVEQSLVLHKILVQQTLTAMNNIADVDVELCCSPNRNTSYFLECENNYSLTLSDQLGIELGERMAFSFSIALQIYTKVVIIGTDCPDMNEKYIRQALVALDERDAVIGPATDGGYVLLGLRRFSLDLFKNISWGSDKVFSQTCKVLKKIGWTYHELEPMQDIDRAEDLRQYKELLNKIS